MRWTWRALGGVLVALVLTVGAAGVCGVVAAATGTLPNPRADNAAPSIPAGVAVGRVHAWLTKALTVRINALAAETLAVAAAHNLTAQDRAALGTIITADQSGVAGLSTTLTNEATIAQLRATADAMVLDYRVFSLLTPQVRGVVLADRELAKAATLTALEPSIQTAITTEKRTGHGAAAAQRIYGKLVVLLSAVEASSADSSAALLALTPQNDSQAPGTFVASAAALTAASSQLVSARADVRRIVKLLAGA